MIRVTMCLFYVNGVTFRPSPKMGVWVGGMFVGRDNPEIKRTVTFHLHPLGGENLGARD